MLPTDIPEAHQSGDFPRQIMDLAWKLLWKKGTPFYLPDLILHGGTVDGKQVDGIDGQTVQSLGPVALFNKKPWGTVAVTFNAAVLSGLSSIQDKGFTFDTTRESFSARVGFDSLIFSGSYALTGDGLAGCTIAGASGVLGLFPARGLEATTDGGGDYDDAHLELARGYRAQLVGTPTGLVLVSNYYNNNDAMNEIVRGDTFFHKRFPTATTDGKNSTDFANQTTLAAQNPTSTEHTVGGEAYSEHSFYMQIAFNKTAVDLYQKSKDDKYLDASNASADFLGKVQQTGMAAQPHTVQEVMDKVASTPSEAARAAVMATTPESPAYKRALDRVENDWEDWKAKGNINRSYTELLESSDLPLGSGTFIDSFGVPTFTFDGEAKITGTVPNVTLTITLTGISVDLPQINLQVNTSNPDTLYQTFVSALAKAQFIHDLLRNNINTALSQSTVLDWFSARINDAIKHALSG